VQHQQQPTTSNLEREKSFVSDASFARQETRGSLTSIKEEDQRKKSGRSGSLAPSKAPISESLKAEVNYIKLDFILIQARPDLYLERNRLSNSFFSVSRLIVGFL